jgi:hypothetical protein
MESSPGTMRYACAVVTVVTVAVESVDCDAGGVGLLENSGGALGGLAA